MAGFRVFSFTENNEMNIRIVQYAVECRDDVEAGKVREERLGDGRGVSS
jgi:hypothetical protein